MYGLYSVLLIDDDPASNYLNERIIRKNIPSAKIKIARNGKEAVEWILNGNYPDLILVDIQMPVMDGIEFLQALHEYRPEIINEVIVAVLSNSNHNKDRNRIQDLGIKHHLVKPFTQQKLFMLLSDSNVDQLKS